jgi:L-ornithine N5-oxygenase
MTTRQVELLAVGAGPANLALAVALEELGDEALARDTMVIERCQAVGWQEGLLMPWAKSQVAFAKDLVTMRNPRSEYSFLNYLHRTGRLDDFINMGNISPYRREVSGYLKWVSESLRKVRFELGCECVSIEPTRDSAGTITGWLTRLADGRTIISRYLVIGIGRDPYVPQPLAGLPARRLVHSTQYRNRVGALPKDHPHRIAVVGAAQSAAEMFQAAGHDLPDSDVTWVMRSIGLRAYDTNKFTNELYYPSFVDQFFDARAEGKEQILREMHRTNYSGVERDMLENLYADLYLDRLAGAGHRRLVTMTDISAAREEDDEIVVELIDRVTGRVSHLRADLVLLGTGFVRSMPWLVRSLAAATGLERIAVTRQYQLVLDQPTEAACYLQGVNEATHGIADSLLSVLAHRSAEITHDILRHRRSKPDAPAMTGGQGAPVTRSTGLVPVSLPPEGGRVA